MWIVFRILTMPLVWLINKILKSEEDLSKNEIFQNFEILELWQKGKKTESFSYHLKLESPLTLGLRKEGMLESLFKTLGLASELNIGLDAFDRQIFVISDESEVRELLCSSQFKLAYFILDLFKKYPNLKIEIKNQKIKLENAKQLNPVDYGVLYEIQKYITQYGYTNYAHQSLHYGKVFFIEFIIWTICAQAIIGIIEYIFYGHTIYLSVKPLIPLTFSFYVGLTIASFLLIKLLLNQSSLIILLLSELMIAIFFFYPIAALSIVSDININMDQSQATDKHFVLMNRREVVSRRSKGGSTTRYYFIIAQKDQINQPDQHIQIEVERRLYAAALYQNEIIVWEKKGYFNINHIDKIELK